MKFTVKGFPEIGNTYEVPDEADLLHMPMFNRINANDFRKYACNYQKSLFDVATLRGNYKHVYVDACIQVLHPETSSIGQRNGEYRENGWHVDGQPTMDREEDSVFHLFQSECTGKTVFNLEPFEIELPDKCELNFFNRAINEEFVDQLVPMPIPSGQFVTFTNHVHRANTAMEIEFRYFFRITESNIMPPNKLDDAIIRNSYTHNYASLKDAKPTVSVMQDSQGVKLYMPMYKRGE